MIRNLPCIAVAGLLLAVIPVRGGEAISSSFFPVPTGFEYYGGFVDANEDGRDDLVILIDHDEICDGDVCDVFLFELVVENRHIDYPCDWRLYDEQRKPFRRAFDDNSVTIGGQIVRLERLPYDHFGTPRRDMACTLHRREWPEYFHFKYKNVLPDPE